MSAPPPEHGSPSPNPEPPAPPAPPAPPRPNLHVSALIVWLTIFPLVAIASVVFGPLMEDWHPVLRALVLTLIVVPIAVYWLMPQMFRWYGAFERRRQARRAGRHAP